MGETALPNTDGWQSWSDASTNAADAGAGAPVDLVVNSDNGFVTWSPPIALEDTSVEFIVRAQDSQQLAETTLTIHIPKSRRLALSKSRDGLMNSDSAAGFEHINIKPLADDTEFELFSVGHTIPYPESGSALALTHMAHFGSDFSGKIRFQIPASDVRRQSYGIP